MNDSKDRLSFSPDGLTEQIINALLTEDRTHAGRRAGYSGWPGGMNPADAHDTKPGGPNRQERAHLVGAPESLTEAIEEIGMAQVHTCVSAHCARCGDSPGNPECAAYWPADDTVLTVAAAHGWRVDPGGRLWCSACAPVLTCEAEGHVFSGWRRPVTRDGQLAGSEYRHCPRCCRHESRPARWLINAGSGRGKSVALPFALLAGTGAGSDVGEVA